MYYCIHQLQFNSSWLLKDQSAWRRKARPALQRIFPLHLMQTFHIISNTMVKSAQHHRPSLNLFLQQHKFPEVTGFGLGFLLGFFTWTQPQRPALGTRCRAHFCMVSCRSRRQNYSPLTISPQWAALGISKPSGAGWVFPNPVAEATETAASNLHWRHRHPRREPASWAPSGKGMLQGREGTSGHICPNTSNTSGHICPNPDVPRCVCDQSADGSICVTCPCSSYFCSLSSCNPLPQMLQAPLATHGSYCREPQPPRSQFLFSSAL